MTVDLRHTDELTPSKVIKVDFLSKYLESQ